MNNKNDRPGWGEEYADYAGVEKQQYERYRQSSGMSLVCWLIAAVTLALALATRVC